MGKNKETRIVLFNRESEGRRIRLQITKIIFVGKNNQIKCTYTYYMKSLLCFVLLQIMFGSIILRLQNVQVGREFYLQIFIIITKVLEKKQGDSLRAIAYLLTKHKEIKVDYFSKRYLEEKINESELKNHLDRYEEELEDRKKI